MNDQGNQSSHAVASLPAAKLKHVVERSNEILDGILQSSWGGDRTAALNKVTRIIHDVFDVESSAFFTVPEKHPNKIVLEASFTDKCGHEFPEVLLDIKSTPKSGITGHIADAGTIVRLHGEEITNHPHFAGRCSEHLLSGGCTSLLAVPLKDRKNRVVGLFRLENKKPLDTSAQFDDVDELIAGIFANKLALGLQNLRMSEIFRRLLEEMQAAKDLQSILSGILNGALALVRAQRGDFALKDKVSEKLVIAAISGPSTETTLRQGAELPTLSFMQRLWDDQERDHLITGNVEEVLPYYQRANPHTKSELAVKFTIDRDPIGVLNAESFRFQAFDEQDIEVLELLSHYAGAAIDSLQKREEAFRALKDSEAIYHSLVESLPQMIFRKDLQEMFTFANQPFCTHVGKPLEQILRKTDFDFYSPECAEKFQRDDQIVLQTQRKVDHEEDNILLTGAKSIVNVVKTPIYDSGGNLIGTQGIFWDISDRRQREKQLEEDRAKLFRWFSHDAPLPLIKIRDSYIPKIERALTDSASGSDAIIDCRNLKSLIEFTLAGFYAYGFVEGGILEWKPQQVLLSEVLGVVLHGVKPDNPDVTFPSEIIPGTLSADVDRNKVMAILYCLIDNARRAVRKANKAEGKVFIRIKGTETALEITVADNGCGLSAEDKQRIGKGEWSGLGSTGVGLSIVKRFADLAGGKVLWEGAFGEGATFNVEIPVTRSSTNRAPTKQ